MRTEDFKPASSLYNEVKKGSRRRGADPEPPPLWAGSTCRHMEKGLCALSVKAYEMGLRDAAQACDGSAPERCEVRLMDDRGLTIPEMFEAAKSRKAKRRTEG